MELCKKLSAKEILGPVYEAAKELEVDQTVDAYAVAGTCNAFETGISTYGNWVRFCGDMEAINYLTGETKRAPKVHMPEVLQNILYEGVKDHAEIVKSKCGKNIDYFQFDKPIEFAYKVTLTRMEDDEKGAIKYKFGVKPLIEVAPNDAIAHLTKLLTGPAPESEPKAKPARTKKAESAA